MKILICGADGFLGRHFTRALEAAGHTVVRGVHHPRQPGDIAIDYRHDTRAAVWLPRLAGIDAVINAVGILHERGDVRFDAIHCAAPCALFDACVAAGVRRVIQVSALGADPAERPAYLASKGRADAHLLALPLTATVLLPTLVFGPGGHSSRFFQTLASLPVHGLPGDGRQPVQPVHVDDLAAAVVALLAHPAPPRRLPAPGPRALAYREMLATYRRGLGLPPAPQLPTPLLLLKLVAPLAARLPGSVLSPDTLWMLSRGNTGDAAPLQQLLGRALRDPADFIPPQRHAASPWLGPLLRLALATVWLGTAAASVSLAGDADGYTLLHQAGLDGPLAPWLLYGGAALDALLGVLTLSRPGPRLWAAQAALILFYTALCSALLPGLWLHPFGPLLKNLPILALLAALTTLPRESRS